MKDLLDFASASSCACANFRRTDLLVTQFYDGMLAPSGLYAIQFGMLSVLARFAPLSIDRLAGAMNMERETLDRHLKILIGQNLVRTQSEDQHTTQIFLTQEGGQALKRAWPLWQEAQTRIESKFGYDRFAALLAELQAVRTVLGSSAS